MGTRFMRRRKSALIDGAGDDARDLSAHLKSYISITPLLDKSLMQTATPNKLPNCNKITVDNEVGEFSEFTVRLMRRRHAVAEEDECVPYVSFCHVTPDPKCMLFGR